MSNRSLGGVGATIAFTLIAAFFLSATSSPAVTFLEAVPVGKGPTQIAVDPGAHNTYVINKTDKTVSVIDPVALTVKALIHVGKTPAAVAANPPAGMAYVANSGAGTITAIKGVKAAGTWKVGGTPTFLAVDSALNQLYVGNSTGNQILILDATKGTVLSTLSTTLQPTSMAVNLVTHSLFVACTGATGSVVVIDGTARQIIKTIGSLPIGATSISVDPVSNVAIIVSPTANTLIVINVPDNYSVTSVPGDTGADPIATAYDPGLGGMFYIADTGDGNVFFADGSGLVTLGNAYQTELDGASALAINTTTNQMGVAYHAAQAAYEIDLLNPLFRQNYHELSNGLGVTGVAFDPLSNRMFVVNATDNTVSAYDVTPGSSAPAYEGDHSGNDVTENFTETNPATGTTYTLRLNDLYAINEAAAGAGANGKGQNSTGVTMIALGGGSSFGLAVNPATNKIYVGDGIGFTYSVNGASNVATILSSVPASASIRSLAVDSASNKILMWDYAGRGVLIFDGTTEALLDTIPVATTPQAELFVDAAKDRAYFVSSPNVVVIDPPAGTTVANIPVTGTELAAAINPPDNRLYIGQTTPSQISVIDTAQNSVVTTISLTGENISCLGVNPVTGNYYAGVNEGGTYHVLEYSGATDTQILDISEATTPVINQPIDLRANPLTNKMYVGTDSGNTTSLVAIIDGLNGTVSALPGSGFDDASHSLAFDLGTGVLGGAGFSYTTLWFPSSDTSGLGAIPIAVTLAGVKDASTIAIKPIFRTHNLQPSFTISAKSNFDQSAAALVPKHGFYQVDGWQGAWTAVNLTAKSGSVTSTAKVRLAALGTGRHILYAYAADGDVATIQGGNSPNSPVISPIGAVVFTIEK